MPRPSPWTIVQVLNNNVVLASRGEERAVLLGRGIGFQQCPGAEVACSAVHQCFVPDTTAPPEQLARLVAEISPAQLDIAQELADLAKDMCRTTLPDTAVVALADHLRFAVNRALHGQVLPAPLEWEVRQLYAAEYAFGQAAIAVVQQRTGIQLDDSEAVSFALHVVTAQYAAGSGDFVRTARLTELLCKSLDVVDAALPGGPGVLDRNSMVTARFITLLRFLLQRLTAPEVAGRSEDPPLERLSRTVTTEYPEAYHVAQQLILMLSFEVGRECSPSEITYLTLHVARLTASAEKNSEG